MNKRHIEIHLNRGGSMNKQQVGFAIADLERARDLMKKQRATLGEKAFARRLIGDVIETLKILEQETEA